MKKITHNNQLRIISGQWRGRKLAFPDMPGLRPTPDRVRETVFNWLTPTLHGAVCLDLFAGSGALGFEALSRGATHATMIDQQLAVVEQLNEHIALLDVKNKARAQCLDAINFLTIIQPQAVFDIVFLDPPFSSDLLVPCCHLLESKQLLSLNAYIYLETNQLTYLDQLPTNWKLVKQKTAGQVIYTLFNKI